MAKDDDKEVLDRLKDETISDNDMYDMLDLVELLYLVEAVDVVVEISKNEKRSGEVRDKAASLASFLKKLAT